LPRLGGTRRGDIRLSCRNGHEILIGDRVLVFLAEKALLNQDVECRRWRVGVFLPKKAYRSGVLLASKNQLLLFLALRHLLPNRHRSGQHDGHDAQSDEQHRHGVAVFGLTT
jgi:hypothetical protein